MTISPLVDQTIAAIGPLDAAAVAAAEARQGVLTKPPGSLGRLESLSIQLAGILGQPIPQITGKAVIVVAGDHGVAAEGVSAFPAEVLTIGVIVIFLLLDINHEMLWRVTLGLGALPALIILVMRHDVPETAVWLVQKGRYREAKQVAREMFNDDLAMLPNQTW